MKRRFIDNFVENLATTSPTPFSINPWDYSKKENEIRRKNLTTYLLVVLDTKPSALLVGEAPGYRGTRRTGVPFSSEKILLAHPFFTSRKEFSIENIYDPIAEASATIVWKTMDELQFYPLIWAAFPFHPHKPENDLTNRTPTREELILGRTFLTSLIEFSGITTILAVGRSAEKTLTEIGIVPTAHIRHPSHGGALHFKEGLKSFVGKNTISI